HRDESPKPEPGIDHLHVAAGTGGRSRQERREEICEPAVRRRVARKRCLSGPELELAARAALILGLQQEIARMTEILAEFDGVVALELREHARDLLCPL